MELVSKRSVAIYWCAEIELKKLKRNRYGAEFLDSDVCLIVLGVLDRLDEGSSLAGVSSHLW